MQKPVPRMIFVNLPVADLATSTDFYTGLGFGLEKAFSDENSSCIVVSSTIYVMLLVRERFADFVAGPVADPASSTQMINCLSATSRDEVDTMVAAALALGGKPWLDRFESGPMYGHSFADPDGHVWELIHMDAPG